MDPILTPIPVGIPVVMSGSVRFENGQRIEEMWINSEQLPVIITPWPVVPTE